MRLPDFDAAVFDLDGTLLDTLQDIAESANRVLTEFGYSGYPRERFKDFVGSGPDVLFQRALGKLDVDPATIDALVDAYRLSCEEQKDRHACLYPGLKCLLDTLVDRGTALAIFSNKNQKHLDTVTQNFLGNWDWQFIQGSGGAIPKKPDPTGLHHILDRLQTEPKRCLYFGDTDVDIQTARAAGCVSIGVLWGFREREELENAGADLLIKHPEELLPLLRSAANR